MRNVLIAALVVLASAGCYYGDPGAATADPSVSWSLIGFTQAGADTMHVAGDMAQADASAPATNTQANTRIGWIVDGADEATNTVCATWASHTGAIDQPGLVVHFDGTHAYTVTQNIYLGNRSAINIHYWDLTLPDASPNRFQLLKSFAPSGIGDGQAWPLRACARAAGPYLDAKIWPATAPEPAWGDPVYGAGILIGAPRAGRGGWYAGHDAAGGRIVMTGLTESSGS